MKQVRAVYGVAYVSKKLNNIQIRVADKTPMIRELICAERVPATYNNNATNTQQIDVTIIWRFSRFCM
jgi:hypothetical protein